MILYFSGSGNTKYFVDLFNAQLGDVAVDMTRDKLPTDLSAETSLGIIFPIYAWGMPPVFKKRLRYLFEHTQLPKNKLYTYVICTCGDDIGTTDKEVAQLLSEYDITMNAVQSVVMPETYVAFPGFYLDKQDVGRKKLEKVIAEIAPLVSRIRKHICFHIVRPGAFPVIKSTIIRPIFNKLLTSDKYYKVNDTCTHCGLCAKACPIQNINYDNGGLPVWHHNCAACLACYHACPMNAISYNFTKGKGQYRLKKYL